MQVQPAGTVTLVFTDVEESTKLLHELGVERYETALDLHRRLLRAAFRRHGGYEVDCEGDSFFVAFGRAADAVAAAADLQTALTDADWPGNPVRVRVGIHTGVPRMANGGYMGLDVHMAARIMNAGHGGQTLLSSATAELIDDHQLVMHDLGDHGLKDFAQPVKLYQVGRQKFPPLRTISNSNLPHPTTPLVGRQREVSDLIAVIRSGNRLVSLTGPGGSGKTRLAIEAAAELVSDFRDGVFWVGLSGLRESTLVIETIGQTLGAHNGVDRHIADKQMLLLLDNFEQVVQAAPELARMLERCQSLVLVVTTRELLDVRGEVEYKVQPLDDQDAVALFCARARVEPDEIVAALCRGLDNLPLAVELAAARARVLSPAQILERLGGRLDLLKGGRDADSRQRTLRATIEWSYELLPDEEKRLFARLGVFDGGWTLDAAEQLAGAEIDSLQSLVDKSVVLFADGRYRMLETIRDYARERLYEAGDVGALSERHARFFAALVTRLIPRPDLFLAEPELRQADAEQANIRAALVWLAEHGPAREFAALIGRLGIYWFMRSARKEAERWLRMAYDHIAHIDDATKTWLLSALSELSRRTGKVMDARQFAELELAYARSVDATRVTVALTDLANTYLTSGDLGRAVELYEEASVVARDTGDLHTQVGVVANLANVELIRGNYQEVVALTDDLKLGASYGEPLIIAMSNRGLALFRLGRMRDAELAFRRTIDEVERLRWPQGLIVAATGLAAIAQAHHQPVRAVMLLSASQELGEHHGVSLEGVEREQADEALSEAKRELPAADFQAAVDRGRAMSAEVLAEFARSTRS